MEELLQELAEAELGKLWSATGAAVNTGHSVFNLCSVLLQTSQRVNAELDCFYMDKNEYSHFFIDELASRNGCRKNSSK